MTWAVEDRVKNEIRKIKTRDIHNYKKGIHS
jgi:hypothetical protein